MICYSTNPADCYCYSAALLQHCCCTYQAAATYHATKAQLLLSTIQSAVSTVTVTTASANVTTQPAALHALNHLLHVMGVE